MMNNGWMRILLVVWFSALLVVTNIKECSSLKCFVLGGDEILIEEERINDNYCDCPFSGKDEPNTSACSGSIEWPGIVSSDEDKKESSKEYKCPDQNKKVPVSRINDGICDCCGSGSDEKYIVCEDLCDVVNSEEIAKRKKMVDNYNVGNAKLLEERRLYEEFKRETLVKISDQEGSLKDFETKVVDLESNYLKDRNNWLNERTNRLKKVVMTHESFQWIHTLTIEESRQLILGLCQLSGEWWSSFQKEIEFPEENRVCVPLHLASLELGIKFEVKDEVEVFERKSYLKNDILIKLLMDMELGFVDEMEPKKYIRKQEEHLEDTEEEDSFDEDYLDEDYDDDDMDPHERHEKRPHEQHEGTNDEETEIVRNEENHEEGDYLVLPRVQIEEKMQQLLKTIENMIRDKKAKEDTVEEGDESEEKKEEEKEEDLRKFEEDLAAMQKLENDLKQFLKNFSQGKLYAKSTNPLIDAFLLSEVYKQDSSKLYVLVASVLYHSRIQNEDVSALLNSIIWNSESNCPPLKQTRNLNNLRVSIPPEEIFQKAFSKCSRTKRNCEESTDIGCITGYHPISYRKRSNNDGLKEGEENGEFYPQYYMDPLNRKVSIKNISEEISELKFQIRDLQKELEENKRLVKTSYGPNGELYPFRNQDCVSITTHKYTYNLCFFGKIHQKDAGSSSTGTSLGKFHEVKEGNLIFKNGLSCWSRKARESLVKMTCGPNVADIVSIDEPEMCSYEFLLESYVACTEAYATLNNIKTTKCVEEEEDEL